MKHICHDERMSDDGVGSKANHEGIMKLSTIVVSLLAHDLGGNRRDG